MKTAEQIIVEKNKPIVTISPDAVVIEALKLMVEKNIGSIIIEEDGIIMGIYTERDLLHHTVREDFDPRAASIRDFMTTKLVIVRHDAPIYKLQDIILGKRCRHLVVVKEGKKIGLLSAGDVLRAQMNEMNKTLESVGWDYYENWCWKKRK